MAQELTLLMVVRDEIMNPAGGILPVLEKQANFYEETIVVDTGSKDGTRELLEHLQCSKEFLNLKVYDIRFNGYADARNRAKELVNTEYAVSLDADELLSPNNPERIREIIKDEPELNGLELMAFKIDHENNFTREFVCWNPRIFRPGSITFFGKLYEGTRTNGKRKQIFPEKQQLLHFVPDKYSAKLKKENWYSLFDDNKCPAIPPSDAEDFKRWKMPNISVLDNYGIDLNSTIKKIESLGLSVPSLNKFFQ